MKTTVKYIIKLLKKGEIEIDKIPREYRNDLDLIEAERRLGFRYVLACGYDIISDKFFVSEKEKVNQSEWKKLALVVFDDFQSYFEYMGGNIYKKACYYQLDTNKITRDVDIKHLYEKKCLINKTIDEFTLQPTETEQIQYAEIEKRKIIIKEWLAKFNECISAQQLENVVRDYMNCTLNDTIEISFFMWNYIFTNISSETHFQSIIQFVSAGLYPEQMFSKSLCSIYDPDKVLGSFEYKNSKSAWDRARFKTLKIISEEVKSKSYHYSEKKYFDKTTHYYCIETIASHKEDENLSFSYKEYFETIDDFAKKLNDDLRGCDLSGVQNINYSFSNCVTDDKTKLPLESIKQYNYKITKIFKSDYFYVTQEWTDPYGNTIKKYSHKFAHFFNYAHFLNGDLSNADLLSCDGLCNLNDISNLNFDNAILPSSMCRKFGIQHETFELNTPQNATFSFAELNEKETGALTYSSDNSINSSFPELGDLRIAYISDLHLDCLIKNRNAQSKIEVISLLQKVANTIKKESRFSSIILISGDTTYTADVFGLFIKTLSDYLGPNKLIVFTLGNHEC